MCKKPILVGIFVKRSRWFFFFFTNNYCVYLNYFIVRLPFFKKEKEGVNTREYCLLCSMAVNHCRREGLFGCDVQHCAQLLSYALRLCHTATCHHRRMSTKKLINGGCQALSHRHCLKTIRSFPRSCLWWENNEGCAQGWSSHIHSPQGIVSCNFFTSALCPTYWA